MNGSPLRPTPQPAWSAWLTTQNERAQAWLRSPAHWPLRQQVQQRLAQLYAALPQPESPAVAITSPDGQWHATVTNNAGSDLQCWQLSQGAVVSAQSCEVINDVYPTGIAWRPDGHGFYYDRYLAYPGAHALYFHRVGTSQRQDRCVFYHAEQPTWHYQPTISPDGRWLAITILNHSACNRLTLLPLLDQPDGAEGTPSTLISRFTGRYDILHWQPARLILRAIEPDAPNGRLLAVNLATLATAQTWERQHPCRQAWLADIPVGAPRSELLVDAVPMGDSWVIHSLQGGCAELQLYNGQDAAQTTVPLPGLGSVLWLEATADPPQLRYGYTDHCRPPQRYGWQPGDCESKPLGEPYRLPYDPAAFVTRQVWIPSADGVLVPLSLTQRRDLPPQPHPTLLTAYGGLGHTHTPHFSADALLWLALGGIYATVCVRGGGELGAGWHQAAVGVHKQRTFDDLLAAARWLVDQGLTTPRQLGLWGISNGGLTAGACLTQAPATFGAVVIDSGRLDRLAYPHLGCGADGVAEYGSPADPIMQPVLAAYSPLHNIRPGCRYPATLITTHEDDPRVGAAHSRHFAQALQRAQGGSAPVLLRVDPGSGHGAPATRSNQLASAIDRLTFLAVNLGLQP